VIRVGRATSAAPAAVDPFVICEIKPDRYRCLHADKGPMGWTSRGCGAAQGRRRKFIVRTSRNSWRLAAATCRKSHAHCDASPLERVEYALIEDHLEFISAQLARVPTRAYLCRWQLVATASIWALLAVLLIR